MSVTAPANRPRTARQPWRLAFALLLALAASRHTLAAVDPTSGKHYTASRDGMVVAPSPYAAEIGARTLEKGGNAVDAAVATAFALIAAEPGMSGLGGRTVLIAGWPGGRVAGIDGATAWPERWKAIRRRGQIVPKPAGWSQVAVPGTPAALKEAHRRWGRLPFAALVRPSIRLARDGFLVTPIQERLLARNAEAISADPVLRRIYLHSDGSPYRAGERLTQPDLAKTLALVARNGTGVFYRGVIARAIARESARRGGTLTLADLRRYRARRAVIDSIRYRDFRLTSVDRPAMGRMLLWRMRVLARLPRYSSRADQLLALAGVLAAEPEEARSRETDAANRRRLLFETGVNDAARSIARRIAMPDGSAVSPWPAEPAGAPPVTHTSHLVTADRRGCVVSLTQSLGPFLGSKVGLPGYGVTFAATMGYLDDEDVSMGPISSIAPTIVFDGRGNPLLAVGAAGSDRIPGVILQVLHNALDRGIGIESAVAAPRISFDREEERTKWLWEGFRRPGVEGLVSRLRGRGLPVEPLREGEELGRVHALMRDPNGAWRGAADPRWFGRASPPARKPAKATGRSAAAAPIDRSGDVARLIYDPFISRFPILAANGIHWADRNVKRGVGKIEE